jgi:hypothetical protein
MTKIPLSVLAWLLIFVFIAFVCFAAAPTLHVTGSTSYERNRISRLESQLNFNQVAMVDDWNIRIDQGQKFRDDVDRMLRTGQIDHYTETGYTNLITHVTVINEDELIWHDDRLVKHTEAHEAAHLICECVDENKAEAIAAILER